MRRPRPALPAAGARSRARDLGAAQVAGGTETAVTTTLGPEQRAILAHPPALVLDATCARAVSSSHSGLPAAWSSGV